MAIDLEDRISTLTDGHSNCRGTALYLCGIRQSDTFAEKGDFESDLIDLNKTKTPQIGDILVFRLRLPKLLGFMERGDPAHAAIVEDIHYLPLIGKMTFFPLWLRAYKIQFVERDRTDGVIGHKLYADYFIRQIVYMFEFYDCTG